VLDLNPARKLWRRIQILQYGQCRTGHAAASLSQFAQFAQGLKENESSARTPALGNYFSKNVGLSNTCSWWEHAGQHCGVSRPWRPTRQMLLEGIQEEGAMKGTDPTRNQLEIVSKTTAITYGILRVCHLMCLRAPRCWGATASPPWP
jgi:hypothetical protein